MANTTPEAMKAWVFKKSGEPKNVLHLEENWPVPTPVGSQVLIKLHATSLNRA
jgi:NADPH:quinone reductase-like Zn-dependent oxidoreductase